LLEGIDNSGKFLQVYSNIDTMYSEAVAIKLTLFDSLYFPSTDYYAGALKSLGITPASALSVYYTFKPLFRVEQIRITTLLDMAPDVKAGDDITDHFVFSTGNSFALYKTYNQALSTFNSEQPYPYAWVVLILKKRVQAPNAQFRVSVSLENGDILEANTNIYTIMP